MSNNHLDLVWNSGAPARNRGGSDGGDGLEARIARLETDVEYIKRDVADIKAETSAIRKTLSRMTHGAAWAAGVIAAATVIAGWLFDSRTTAILDAIKKASSQ